MTVDRKTIVAAVATALISSAAFSQGACMNDLQMLTSLCVPKTSSVLIRGGNRLTSAHHDCDAMFRAGHLGRTI